MKGNRRLLLVFSVIAILVILLSQCISSEKELIATETTRAGANSCKQCHQQLFEDFSHDPHTNTSREITGDNLVQHSVPASDVFEFNENVKIVVEKRKDGMYQVAYFEGEEGIARRFDIAIGSGKNAYTFGSWRGPALTQLPLSYFRKINTWANSPGFPKDRVYFSRQIEPRCLECHSSFIDHKAQQSGGLMLSQTMERKSLIYGIDCERCHGPAGKHVEFHIKSPEEKNAKYIKLFKTLTRKQRINNCAICHSGIDMQALKSTFSYKPGDSIQDYYTPATDESMQKEPDVHGNQIQMLANSKCFIKSADMDCNTCHNLHQSKKGDLTLYSKQCMSCHSTIKHSEKTLANAMVKTNCIDCHMPLQASKVISFQQAGRSDVSQYSLHTHRIAVYDQK